MSKRVYVDKLRHLAAELEQWDETDRQLRENQDFRPEVIEARRQEAYEQVRARVDADFQNLLSRAQAAQQVQIPEPESDWQERTYWHTRYRSELADMPARDILAIAEDVAERGSVARKAEFFPVAERVVRESGGYEEFAAFRQIQEQARTPEEREAVAAIERAQQTAALVGQLHSLTKNVLSERWRNRHADPRFTLPPSTLVERMEEHAKQAEALSTSTS